MKLAIAGFNGRMGQSIQALADAHPDIDAVIGLSRDSSFDEATAADVIIEFTRPEYSLKLLEWAKAHHKPLVSGTTGLSEAEFAQLESASQTIPVFWASNMSVGVAVLMDLVKQAAAALPDSYDTEIIEMHHRHKVDAPSGTALSLGKAVADGREIDFVTNAKLSREGNVGERKKGEIGFATLRGGTIIGEHEVIFAGDHDVLTLSHRSQSRDIYAEGAIRAALWLEQQPPGLYGMAELLANSR